MRVDVSAGLSFVSSKPSLLMTGDSWVLPVDVATGRRHVATDNDGNVYVATRTWEPHQGSLIVLSDLGTARDTWPLGARPVDVEVALDGTAHVLVLCCSGRGLGVVTIAPDGRRSGGWMAWMELYLPYILRH